jgi:hypothetical protein
MWFQLVQIVYWLALATWFGSVMFIAIAAPIIFRTVRQANPVMTSVLSVNLEGQHATLLAGSVVGNILARLALIELGCAGAILLTTIAQFLLADMTGSNFPAAMLRLILCIAAGAIVGCNRFLIWPRIVRSREQYIDHADEPEVANPAKDRFDRDHRLSMTLLTITLGALLLLILYSSNVTPARTTAPVAVPPVSTGG